MLHKILLRKCHNWLISYLGFFTKLLWDSVWFAATADTIMNISCLESFQVVVIYVVLVSACGARGWKHEGLWQSCSSFTVSKVFLQYGCTSCQRYRPSMKYLFTISLPTGACVCIYIFSLLGLWRTTENKDGFSSSSPSHRQADFLRKLACYQAR